MNDKNLLERLGIIQKVDDEDGSSDLDEIATATSDNDNATDQIAQNLAKLVFVDEKAAEPKAPSNLSSAAKVAETASIAASKVKEIPSPTSDKFSRLQAFNPTKQTVKIVGKKSPSPSIAAGPAPIVIPKSVDDIKSTTISEKAKDVKPMETTKTKSEKERFLEQMISETPTATYEATPDETQEPIYMETDEGGYLSVDQYTTISELYKNYGKKSAGTDTIFIVDAFTKSLPENLSKNIKRQSVLNIIEASKINLENLISDGLERIEVANAFLTEFTGRTNEIVSQKEAEVASLEEHIKNLKKEIKERTRLQEKQDSAVEQETYKIKAALDFISYSDNAAE